METFFEILNNQVKIGGKVAYLETCLCTSIILTRFGPQLELSTCLCSRVLRPHWDPIRAGRTLAQIDVVSTRRGLTRRVWMVKCQTTENERRVLELGPESARRNPCPAGPI